MAQVIPHYPFAAPPAPVFATPAMIAGVGCAFSIPLITVFLHRFFRSGTGNNTVTGVDFLAFPTPINAVPDKPPSTIPLFSVETSADTTPAMAFMDVLEAYEKEQETLRVAAEEEKRAARAMEQALAEEAHAKETSWHVSSGLVLLLSDLVASIILASIIIHFIRITNFLFARMAELTPKFKAFLKSLCVAMVTRSEPDMETLTVAVQKGMMQDPAFLAQLASNPDFLAMVMQQPVFVLLVEQKAKHYHERESAQFQANVVDPFFKSVAATESQTHEYTKRHTLMINNAVQSFKKVYFDSLEAKVNSVAARSSADKGQRKQTVASLAALEAKLDAFMAEASADGAPSKVAMAEAMEATKRLDAQLDLFTNLASQEKSEDVELVRRLFMITHQDHATAARLAKATEGKKGTDKLHAVLTAHIETLSIMMHDVKRKIEPVAYRHGQQSTQSNWVSRQPNGL